MSTIDKNSLDSIIQDLDSLNAKDNLESIKQRLDNFKSSNRFWYNSFTKSPYFYSESSVALMGAAWIGSILGLGVAFALPGILAGVFLVGAAVCFLGFYLLPKIYTEVEKVSQAEQKLSALEQANARKKSTGTQSSPAVTASARAGHQAQPGKALVLSGGPEVSSHAFSVRVDASHVAPSQVSPRLV